MLAVAFWLLLFAFSLNSTSFSFPWGCFMPDNQYPEKPWWMPSFIYDRWIKDIEEGRVDKEAFLNYIMENQPKSPSFGENWQTQMEAIQNMAKDVGSRVGSGLWGLGGLGLYTLNEAAGTVNTLGDIAKTLINPPSDLDTTTIYKKKKPHRKPPKTTLPFSGMEQTGLPGEFPPNISQEPINYPGTTWSQAAWNEYRQSLYRPKKTSGGGGSKR
jgi:hypothetical protein